MTIHRPHPISGPWPFAVDEDKVGTMFAEAGSRIPLVERVPTDESRIYDDPEDALLFDGCDRCEQHATHPTASVDDESLARLWARMVEVERDPTYTAHYRTRAEAEACRHLYAIAVFVERTHPSLDPWTWRWHLKRWPWDATADSFELSGREAR